MEPLFYLIMFFAVSVPCLLVANHVSNKLSIGQYPIIMTVGILSLFITYYAIKLLIGIDHDIFLNDNIYAITLTLCCGAAVCISALTATYFMREKNIKCPFCESKNLYLGRIPLPMDTYGCVNCEKKVELMKKANMSKEDILYILNNG